jgi:hypothetical protein
MKCANEVLDKNLDYGYVEKFARETGDLASLSTVDRQVIAYGVNQARLKGDMDKLRKEPQPLSEFRPRGYKADFDRKDQEDGTWTDSDEEEEETPKQSSGDDWDVVP